MWMSNAGLQNPDRFEQSPTEQELANFGEFLYANAVEFGLGLEVLVGFELLPEWKEIHRDVGLDMHYRLVSLLKQAPFKWGIALFDQTLTDAKHLFAGAALIGLPD